MKSLANFGLQNGDALIYTSPLSATAAALDHPHSTSLAGEINTLVLAYLNQWGFLLSAYSHLHNIQSLLAKSNDQIDPEKAKEDPNGPWPLTEYDRLSANLSSGIRDYTYILVITMKSIFDFYVCLIEAVRNKKVPSGRSMIDLAQFRNKIMPKFVSGIFSFLNDQVTYPLPDKISEIRNRIVHRGYSIRTNHSFTKETDLPIVLFQGNDHTDDRFNFSVGDLFADFYATIHFFELQAADILPVIQPDLLLSPKLSVSYRLDGDATLVEFKEIST